MAEQVKLDIRALEEMQRLKCILLALMFTPSGSSNALAILSPELSHNAMLPSERHVAKQEAWTGFHARLTSCMLGSFERGTLANGDTLLPC